MPSREEIEFVLRQRMKQARGAFEASQAEVKAASISGDLNKIVIAGKLNTIAIDAYRQALTEWSDFLLHEQIPIRYQESKAAGSD
jgi:hypothetical protein